MKFRITSQKSKVTLLLTACGLLSFTAAGGSVIFTNNFDNITGGGNHPINEVDANTVGQDWSSYYYVLGTSASDFSATTPGASGARVGIANASGVNNDPGYVFSAGGTDNVDAFSALGTVGTLSDVGTISWYQASNAGVVTQLLVQSGGSWYVSAASWDSTDVGGLTGATELQNEPGDGTNLISFTYDPTASNWNMFDPAAASPIGVAASSDLDTSVTGLGFFLSGAVSGTGRVDTLTVTNVPEPETMALLAGALALGLVYLRRRRQ